MDTFFTVIFGYVLIGAVLTFILFLFSRLSSKDIEDSSPDFYIYLWVMLILTVLWPVVWGIMFTGYFLRIVRVVEDLVRRSI